MRDADMAGVTESGTVLSRDARSSLMGGCWSVARRLRDAPLALLIGGSLVALLVLLGLLSLVWTPYPPGAIFPADRLLPPGSDGYPLGTDRIGRDVLSQIMAGARTSLLISVVSTMTSVVPGLLLGLFAAAASPFWQGVLTRITDFAIALPAILLALVLATRLGPGFAPVVIALVLAMIPGVARLTIGPARQILARDYVRAAFAYGRGRWFVLLRHVTPNIAPVIIVQMSLLFAAAILAEAGLSYLGLGPQPPTSSWGRLLNEAQQVFNSAPTLVVFPGIAITMAVFGFNLLGDGLRIILDPHRHARYRADDVAAAAEAGLDTGIAPTKTGL